MRPLAPVVSSTLLALILGCGSASKLAVDASSDGSFGPDAGDAAGADAAFSDATGRDGPPGMDAADAAMTDADASPGDASDALLPYITRGTGEHEGVVAGFVIDDETEAPLPAQVLVNGAAVPVLADGSFTVQVSAGRARVEVRSDGYLDGARDVVTGRSGLPMPFALARRSLRQVASAAGSTLAFRESMLVVPPGAYATDTPVSLTFVNRTRVAAIASLPQFIDDKGVPWRAVALLDLSSDSPSAKPVRLRVPVPDDASVASVAGFVITAGRWSTPFAPDAVAGGFADITLKGPAQIGVAVDVRGADGKRPGYLVTQRGDTLRIPGELLTAGTELVTNVRAMDFVDALGTRFELAPASHVRLGMIDEMPSAALTQPLASQLDLLAGQVRVATAGESSAAFRLTIAGQLATYQVASAAFSLDTSGAPPDAVDFLDVVAGQVIAFTKFEHQDVSTGETATIKLGCAAGDAGCPPDSDRGAPPDAAGSPPDAP